LPQFWDWLKNSRSEDIKVFWREKNRKQEEKEKIKKKIWEKENNRDEKSNREIRDLGWRRESNKVRWKS